MVRLDVQFARVTWNQPPGKGESGPQTASRYSYGYRDESGLNAAVFKRGSLSACTF